ncbi:hypothetical protein EVAR_63638_1 [Eumeta japonica]|uniref:Uncharacterized protein n=1 Tax=Eumeta variegata TaxID=151549 RepID=A0A4C2A134_EUMVA|nr:hypothetical protein EVAR_63638_1 [Eumeta japonica]
MRPLSPAPDPPPPARAPPRRRRRYDRPFTTPTRLPDSAEISCDETWRRLRVRYIIKTGATWRKPAAAECECHLREVRTRNRGCGYSSSDRLTDIRGKQSALARIRHANAAPGGTGGAARQLAASLNNSRLWEYLIPLGCNPGSLLNFGLDSALRPAFNAVTVRGSNLRKARTNASIKVKYRTFSKFFNITRRITRGGERPKGKRELGGRRGNETSAPQLINDRRNNKEFVSRRVAFKRRAFGGGRPAAPAAPDCGRNRLCYDAFTSEKSKHCGHSGWRAKCNRRAAAGETPYNI